MAKKLQLEIDVQNKRAKKAAEEVGKAAADGIERAAAASGRLADNLGKASAGIGLSGKQLAAAAAGMGGMLVGTVAKAVSLRSEEGSAAQKALGYGGAAVEGLGKGLAMGSMFGPLGTAIGALVGALNGVANKFLDDETAEKKKREETRKTNEANREMVDGLLEAQRRTEQFQKTVDSLGDREKTLAERQGEVAAEIARREEAEKRLQDAMRRKSAAGATEDDQKALGKAVGEYRANSSELSRLRAMQKSMEEEAKKGSGAYRTWFGAADALARIGGSFGGGTGGGEAVAVARDQLAVLKSIDAKTKNGGAAWQ